MTVSLHENTHINWYFRALSTQHRKQWNQDYTFTSSNKNSRSPSFCVEDHLLFDNSTSSIQKHFRVIDYSALHWSQFFFKAYYSKDRIKNGGDINTSSHPFPISICKPTATGSYLLTVDFQSSCSWITIDDNCCEPLSRWIQAINSNFWTNDIFSTLKIEKIQEKGA